VTLAHDDNVFRVSPGAPFVFRGSGDRADMFTTTSFGLNLNIPVERQRFRAGVTFSDTRYKRFDILDHTSHNANAAWLYQVGNDLSGEVGYSDTRALGSLANVQSGVQSGVKNILKQKRAYANGAYLLTPSWRLSAGAANLEHRNSTTERLPNDMDLTTGEAGVTYISRASNEIGLHWRGDRGDLRIRQPLVGATQPDVDNDFKQNTLSVVGLWVITPASRLSGRIGHVKREYAELRQRDFSDPVYRVTYEWRPTDKVTFSGSVFREISLVEEINVGFVRARGVAARAAWRPTTSTELAGLVETSRRDALGEADRVAGVGALGGRERTDHLTAAAITASWRPYRWLTLGAGFRHERRTSNEAFGDYRSNAVNVSGRASF
jgi:exopolysaccharide biosynthesis operon protein EpsL